MPYVFTAQRGGTTRKEKGQSTLLPPVARQTLPCFHVMGSSVSTVLIIGCTPPAASSSTTARSSDVDLSVVMPSVTEALGRGPRTRMLAASLPLRSAVMTIAAGLICCAGLFFMAHTTISTGMTCTNSDFEMVTCPGNCGRRKSYFILQSSQLRAVQQDRQSDTQEIMLQ